MSFSLNLKKLMLKTIRMNLLAFYSKCHNLIGDPPCYLFRDGYCVKRPP